MADIEKPTLKTTINDRIAANTSLVAGVIPGFGGLISHAITQIIPDLKLDRIEQFLKYLDHNVSRIDSELKWVKGHLESEEGLDLFEDAVVQAGRAISDERKQRLASILSRSFSREDLKYAESKKILNLLRELTDQELIFMYYYSKPLTMGSKFHNDLTEQYPELLEPVSKSFDTPQKDIDRGALQDSYRNTLTRLGLLDEKRLSPLGKLVIRYIEDDETETT